MKNIHKTPIVAIMSQSDRTDRITSPLETTRIPFEVDPPDPHRYDILIVETPDRKMLKEVARRPFNDTKLLFRLRGDPYWGIDQWIDSRIKQQVALRMLKYVNGCVAIAPHQARTYVEKTQNPTHIVPLSIDVDEWPTTTHSGDELRMLSLTNCMYPQKIKPIIHAAPTVDTFLDRNGGTWVIGGSGIHADELQRQVKWFDNIEFCGYVDAKEELERANMMLHLSYFDSFANAILEGMASNLPVVTTDYVAFTEQNLPVHAVDNLSDMDEALERYTDPEYRQAVGDRNHDHVSEYYNHARVGKAWNRALLDFFRKDLPGEVLHSAHEVCWSDGPPEEPEAPESSAVVQ